MLVFKKILLDIILVTLLLILTSFIGAAIKIQNPDCLSCAINISITLWLATAIALQPVIWTTSITKINRFIIWFVAVTIGVLTYILMEYIGIQLLASGNTLGLHLGLYANIAFYIVSLTVSLLGVRFIKRKLTSSPPN